MGGHVCSGAWPEHLAWRWTALRDPQPDCPSEGQGNRDPGGASSYPGAQCLLLRALVPVVWRAEPGCWGLRPRQGPAQPGAQALSGLHTSHCCAVSLSPRGKPPSGRQAGKPRLTGRKQCLSSLPRGLPLLLSQEDPQDDCHLLLRPSVPESHHLRASGAGISSSASQATRKPASA